MNRNLGLTSTFGVAVFHPEIVEVNRWFHEQLSRLSPAAATLTVAAATSVTAACRP